MTGHIFIEGEVGPDVNAKTVRSDIANYPQATDFVVHVNSGGGDVYEGYQIGNILKNLGKPTLANIGGVCASIATYAALCCDQVIMGPSGDFMIHLPTGTIQGTAEDLRRGAAQLDRIKSELIDRYMARVAKKGVTREQVSEMIDKETSMSPQEAMQMGFVDDVREKLKAVAKVDYKKFKDMDAITKEEAKGMFESLGNRIDKLFKALSGFKNLDIVLADGTPIVSDAASPDAIQGSNVTDATGAPLADGEYETQDGFEMEVAGGVVTDYAQLMNDKKIPGATGAPVPGDVPAVEKRIQQMQKDIAELKGALGNKAKEAELAIAAKAEAEKSFVAQVKLIKDELESIKAKTFGDTAAPVKNTSFRAGKKENTREADPMLEAMGGDLGNAWLTSRTFPQNNFN